MTRNDEVLWSRWTERRDARAFEALVARYQRFVYDFARRVSRHDADAEDLAQEALLDLAEAPADRPPAVGLKAFLGRRLVLGAKMLKRASLTRAQHERSAARDVAQPPPFDARSDAEAALALLGADDRHAVELRFLHDLSYAEVAHVLGVTEAAARMRVHRALKPLKERLGERATALVAGLALFVPPSRFARTTARAAALAAGGAFMGKKIALAAIAAIALLAGGTAVVVSRGETAPPPRAEHTAVTPAPEKPAATPALPAEPETARTLPAGKGGVRGTVRFVDGTPLRGEQLALWGGQAVIATTDEYGAFDIFGEWIAQRDLCLLGPHRSHLAIAKPTLLANKYLTLDVRLQPGLAYRGRVLFEDDRGPADDARVYLRRVDAAADGVAQASWAHVYTDAEGRFEFRHLLPGRHLVSITRPRMEAFGTELELQGDDRRTFLVKRPRRWTIRFTNLPERRRGAEVWVHVSTFVGDPLMPSDIRGTLNANGELHGEAPPPGRYHLTTSFPRTDLTVTVGEGALEPVVFELPATRRIEGAVVLPDGNPGVGIRVSLEKSGLGAKTDVAGEFAFEDVPEGEEELRLHFGRARLLIKDPASIATYRLTGTGSIRGSLAANTGWRFVSLSNENGHVAEADSDEEGNFVIPHLEPGDYVLTAWDSNLSRQAISVRVAGSAVDVGSIKIDPIAVIPVVVTAPEGVKLGGRHTGGASNGRGGVMVQWVLNDRGRGHVRVPLGKWRIEFRLHNFPTQVVERDVKATGNAEIRLTFAR